MCQLVAGDTKMNTAGPLPLRSLWSGERLILHNIAPLFTFKSSGKCYTVCRGRRGGQLQRSHCRSSSPGVLQNFTFLSQQVCQGSLRKGLELKAPLANEPFYATQVFTSDNGGGGVAWGGTYLVWTGGFVLNTFCTASEGKSSRM